MSGYGDNFWQRRAINQNSYDHRDQATPEEYASRFNATRNLFDQAQEEEMGSPAVGERGKF
jgi:hypothetical protein